MASLFSPAPDPFSRPTGSEVETLSVVDADADSGNMEAPPTVFPGIPVGGEDPVRDVEHSSPGPTSSTEVDPFVRPVAAVSEETRVASSGKPLTFQPPRLVQGSIVVPESIDEYMPSDEASFQDLSEVNLAINRSRRLLFECEKALRDAAVASTAARLNYERQLRRKQLSISGKTVADRSAAAEILCEDAEEDMKFAEVTLELLKRASSSVKNDLSALEAISHNLRAQMKLI